MLKQSRNANTSGEVIKFVSFCLFSGSPDLIFNELILLIRFAFYNKPVLHVFSELNSKTGLPS